MRNSHSLRTTKKVAGRIRTEFQAVHPWAQDLWFMLSCLLAASFRMENHLICYHGNHASSIFFTYLLKQVLGSVILKRQ